MVDKGHTARKWTLEDQGLSVYEHVAFLGPGSGAKPKAERGLGDSWDCCSLATQDTYFQGDPNVFCSPCI